MKGESDGSIIMYLELAYKNKIQKHRVFFWGGGGGGGNYQYRGSNS